MKPYTHSNADLLFMAIDEFKLTYEEAMSGQVDRTERVVRTRSGVYPVPADWDLS